MNENDITNVTSKVLLFLDDPIGEHLELIQPIDTILLENANKLVEGFAISEFE